MRSLEGVLPLIDEYKWAIDVELCIFPQEGLLNNPGTDELMVAALKRGGMVVGAAPYTDSSPHGQIDRVFEMAREFDLDIDMHLDFAPTPDDMDLVYVCELADRFKYGGRVAIGHVTKMSAAPPETFKARAQRMADAGVALTVLPSTDLYLMGRHMNHSVMRGVTAGASSPALRRELFALDQQRAQSVHAVRRLLADPHGEPLRQHRAGRCARRHPRVLQHGHGALRQAACGCKDYGIAVGGPADLLVFDCESPEAAVAQVDLAALRVQARPPHIHAARGRTAPPAMSAARRDTRIDPSGRVLPRQPCRAEGLGARAACRA